MVAMVEWRDSPCCLRNSDDDDDDEWIQPG